jgi:hypothetical protein
MAEDLTRGTWGPLSLATPEECRKASRYVASQARDKQDATELLAILGLLPARHPAMIRPDDHGLIGYRLGCRCKPCRKANSNRLDRQRAAAKGGA